MARKSSTIATASKLAAKRWRWRVFQIYRTRMLPTRSRSAIESAYPRPRDRRLSRKTRAAVGKPSGSATAARAVSRACSPEAKGLQIGQPGKRPQQ